MWGRAVARPTLVMPQASNRFWAGDRPGGNNAKLVEEAHRYCEHELRDNIRWCQYCCKDEDGNDRITAAFTQLGWFDPVQYGQNHHGHWKFKAGTEGEEDG